MVDLRLSSPRTSWSGPPPYWLLDDEADDVWAPDVDGEDQDDDAVGHQGGQRREPGGDDDAQPPVGFHWADAARWRAPRPGSEPETTPPRWLGVPPRRSVRSAPPVPMPVEPLALRVFRLGCVMPSGGVVAVVMRGTSPDAAWTSATWDGSDADVGAVLACATALVPDWLDEWSPWGLVPGSLTPRAVAAAMVEVAGWDGVTVGVRAVLRG